MNSHFCVSEGGSEPEFEYLFSIIHLQRIPVNPQNDFTQWGHAGGRGFVNRLFFQRWMAAGLLLIQEQPEG